MQWLGIVIAGLSRVEGEELACNGRRTTTECLADDFCGPKLYLWICEMSFALIATMEIQENQPNLQRKTRESGIVCLLNKHSVLL